MAKIQASTPQGTRDFGPDILRKRKFIFQSISTVFEKYGYQPIETPTMENLSTLTGKYGEEGDRLIFKILNSGDFLTKLKGEIGEYDSKKLGFAICDKALRYDLTVPFARFVVQHRNEITLPFKRYQIQPVWRADRPQKGRYREFYQCDADVVGSDSLLYEIEYLQIFDEVLSNLGLPGFTIKINNRKILAGLVQKLQIEDKFTSFLIGLDKLDKIGLDGVSKELIERGFEAQTIETAFSMLVNNAGNFEKLDMLEKFFQDTPLGLKGVEELRFVLKGIDHLGSKKAEIELDFTLARGLDYYTGAIFEVKAHEVQMGSICGGGRYDNLTGIFGLEGISGVGISFGADRIFDVMEELKLFPDTLNQSTQVLIANFGENEALEGLKVAQKMREHQIRTELYPESAKLKKQFDYAEKKLIPFMLMLGENEVKTGIYILKNQISGEQISGKIDELITYIKHSL